MKSVLTITGVIVLVSVILCTAAQGQKTSIGYDKNVDFSNYKTFAFDKSGARNPFVNTIIVEAVERELTARRLTKVDTDSNPARGLSGAIGSQSPGSQFALLPGCQSCLQRVGGRRLDGNVGCYDGDVGDRSL